MVEHTSNSGNSGKSSLEHTSNSANSSMVEHNCGNNKCIMCGPAPPQRTQETGDTATVRVAVVSSLNNNNNNSSSSVAEQSSEGSRPQVAPPPPLPKKTVAPYQEYKFGLEEPMPSMADQSAAAGRDKRRKKQATKRMEQLIKIHTENVDLSDAGEQLQLVRTLDRSEAGAETAQAQHPEAAEAGRGEQQTRQPRHQAQGCQGQVRRQPQKAGPGQAEQEEGAGAPLPGALPLAARLSGHAPPPRRGGPPIPGAPPQVTSIPVLSSDN